MKAGRELDALIAEKVMGICGHYLNRVDETDPFGDRSIYYRCGRCHETFQGLAFKEGYCAFPHYSIRIADAWLVVGKLDLPFTLQKNKQFKGGHYASFIVDKKFKAAQAATAPLAICLAALEAIA